MNLEEKFAQVDADRLRLRERAELLVIGLGKPRGANPMGKPIEKAIVWSIFSDFLGSGAWICQSGAWNCLLGA